MKVQPFLMFQGGVCEEAISFYVATLAGSEIVDLKRFGAGQPGEGLVMMASFTIGGQTILANDSPVKHAFTFTPSSSLFVTCESEAELDTLVTALAQGGQFLMPPNAYGFSRKFAWLNDRFGVSWQVNLP